MATGRGALALILLIQVLLLLLWSQRDANRRIAIVDRRNNDAYKTAAGPVDGKLNVHLVPHTHDDVGWLKTVDQYYIGSNNSIQIAAVQYIIDSVITSLQENPDRKFIYVEQAFFQRWWRQQTLSKQTAVRKLVESGQLEFINGGWCMHDEAGTSYIDMIDQTTLGHRFIKSQFNKLPRIGWQIDPFGHSAVQAYLLGAELGFDGLFFARADYQDIAKRRVERSMEFVWQGSKSLGSSAQIFGGVLANHYSPPEGMNYDFKSNDPLIQDDPLLYDYNLQERIDFFVRSAQEQSKQFRTNHIMWTMGQDFCYENANTWFKQMDKMVHYMNKDGRTNVFYSTPSIYVDTKNAANISWPLKTEDFFPYANCSHCYWTGYFSSRLALKGYVRRLSASLMASRQLELLIGRDSLKESTDALEDAVAILQHHDGVTGTEQQHVANDYAKRLARGADEAAKVMEAAISILTSGSIVRSIKRNESWLRVQWRGLVSSFVSIIWKGLLSVQNASGFHHNRSTLTFNQCALLNISHCPPSEIRLAKENTLVVVAYNPVAWSRKEIVRIPVSSDSILVKDSSGTVIPCQIIPLDSVSRKLRETYVVAYTGNSPSNDNVYTLVFEASVPPLGFSTYFVSNYSASNASISSLRSHKHVTSFEIFSDNILLNFSSTTGRLEWFTNRKTGISTTLRQSYCWYNSSDGVTTEAPGQPSGAYVFRPNSSICYPVDIKDKTETIVLEGALVQEVYQQYSPWVSQVIRLYKDADYVEMEYTVGPVPVNSSDAGKEVVTRLSTNLASADRFYTDSNGRDFLERIRNYRKDWDLNVTEPISGNYYPLNLGIFLHDNSTDFSVLVDRTVGGSSLTDGEIELMVQRRLLHDDHRGVQEALNERVCLSDNSDCEGLTVRGVFRIGINSREASARWRRSQGQRLYSPLELLFSSVSSTTDLPKMTTFSAMKEGYELPPNIAVITLQELHSKEVLIRLAHLYEIDEDKELSGMVRVDLQKLFAFKQIVKVVELNLSANQERAAMKPLKWRVQQRHDDHRSLRGALVKPEDRHIEIAPMEIRTLQITFS